MSAEPGLATHETVARIHREGLQVADRIGPTISAIMTDLARAKGLHLPEPVVGVLHSERTGRDHRYATITCFSPDDVNGCACS